jgi:glycosyltransferase involved in cell wall biosynthesis
MEILQEAATRAGVCSHVTRQPVTDAAHSTQDPTTEILLCTYNGAPFILEQLQSILYQTTAVTKISIYDDCSSDNTVVRIHEFVNQLPSSEQTLFAVHVNATNLGYARNFINAVENATQDILFLCDQDDIWEPQKVASLLELLREAGPDLVFSDGALIDESGRPLDRTTVLQSYGLAKADIAHFQERAFELLLKQNYVNGAAAAIRRTRAQSALPLPCDMPHDYWLAIWCSLHGGIVATPQALYRYRQHRRNVIGAGSSNPMYEWLGIWRHPNVPRERELHIWRAVTNRIDKLPSSKEIDAAHRKLDWLTRIVSHDKRLSRVLEILKSALNGNYRHYSSADSFFRDLVSLIK